MSGTKTLVGAALLLQGLLLSLSFPLDQLLTEKPLLHNDAGYHWYQITLAKDLARTGTLVGYDSNFNAGYPGGVTYNWSAKAPTAVATLLGDRITPVVAYKLHSFVSALLGPCCVALALRWLGFDIAVSLLGTLLGFLLWWASMFRWYHTAGMVSFVFCSYAALPYAAAVLRYLDGKGDGRHLAALGLTGALLVFCHFMFPIPVAVVVAGALLAGFRPKSAGRAAAVFLLLPVMGLAPNLIWLLPARHYWAVFAAGVPDPFPHQKLVDASVLWKELAGIWGATAHGSKVYFPLAISASFACFARHRDRRTARAWTIAAIALAVVAAVGAAAPPIAQIQPNRFAPVAYLCLCVPAAIGLGVLLERALSSAAGASRTVGRVLLALALPGLLFAALETVREVTPGPRGRYGVGPPDVRGVGEKSRWVLEWLRTRTDASGRILFETSRALVYDGDHVAGYLSRESDREFIGGPYPYHHFAGFWDGTVFNRRIETIPSTVFLSYMQLYNVRWIVVHSEESKRYLAGVPGVLPVGAHEDIQTYRIEREPSFFVVGSGAVVSRKPNQLVLDGLAGHSVVLKYHYISGLRSDPPASVEGVRLMDDPNPFIRLTDPPRHLTLRLP